MKISFNAGKNKKGDSVLKILRIIAYLEIIFICLIISFSGSSVKPLLLIPLAVAISTWTDELTAAICGFFCGIITDILTNTLIGFNALILVIACTFVSFLYVNYLRRKFINFLIIDSAICIIQGFLWYFFNYLLWNKLDGGIVFKNIIFKSIIYTIIASIFIYFAISLINRKIKPYQMNSIEEVMQSEYSNDDED